MGTIQDPNPDHDWLKRTHADTSTNPFSVEAQAEMMGRLAEGTGGSRATRTVIRVVAVIGLIPVVVFLVRGIVDLLQ